ncbi:MAG: HAD-IC family P-type ATPase [Clostridiales bacterium]|nr:HAD-IC family P-type ATPase [Clostridiales bacterium]
MDDCIYLKTGDQVPADAEVLEGSLEVNESLLTGEADNMQKNPGDSLFSCSFVTSGQACCRVVHAGSENYASQITSEAREFKQHNSELRNSINIILKVISIIIVPLGILLFYKQYVIVGDSFRDSVVNMTSGVLGMIPEGLVLLTSVTLTLGALYLAQRKTLVQELFCIETLARVDTLCLDKTGTITEGSMCVEMVEEWPPAEIPEDDGSKSEAPCGLSEETGQYREIARVMGNLLHALQDQNATTDALRKKFPLWQDMTPDFLIPFSSDRKYSGVSFQGEGTYLMGAAQFLFPEGYRELGPVCASYAAKGYRVLVLAHSPAQMDHIGIPEDLEPTGLLILTDVIRAEAPETLQFFADQGVDLKVISGDDPVTVSVIAQKAGLKNAERYVDASVLTTQEEMDEAMANYSVFGRVTPQQKRAMVRSLKSQGHTVAMTGDGVNDVLALKEADCSIAMAEGSDAAKNIANVVLLDSNFASMPHIVNQGPRVVNNIRTAASMFLIKTIFSVLLSLLTILFGEAYPFEPIQMSLISACAVGVPPFSCPRRIIIRKLTIPSCAMFL